MWTTFLDLLVEFQPFAVLIIGGTVLFTGIAGMVDCALLYLKGQQYLRQASKYTDQWQALSRRADGAITIAFAKANRDLAAAYCVAGAANILLWLIL